VMFQQGGISYVYLCYGMHNMLNIVTNQEGTPHAILIRAIEPVDGIVCMLKRRKKEKVDKTLTNGPGTVAQAFGIDRRLNGLSLLGETLWIEKGEIPKRIVAGPRIGIDYSGQDAELPWRFIAR
jgi:DNA-3-methyladenine glycosylase